MADLLDVSPVRARYYRTPHRLYRLDALGELHQKMHLAVKGFEIRPRRQVPSELRLVLTWRRADEQVRGLSDWLLHWLTSQWRLLAEPLKEDSSGAIRWAEPWAEVVFAPARGPQETLSDEAMLVLAAERREQRRIDRDELAERFLQVLDGGGRILFRIDSDPKLDGQKMADWCECQARRRRAPRTARLDRGPAEAKETATLVAILSEQLGVHLPAMDEEEALAELRRVIVEKATAGFVVLIAADPYDEALFEPILGALFAAPPAAGRPEICVLLTPQGAGPSEIADGEVYRLPAGPLGAEDVRRHLQQSWGYDPRGSTAVLERVEAAQLLERPGVLYDYLATHCTSWKTDEP